MASLPLIPLAAPTFGDEEVEAVRAALESGWVAGQGPRGRELEERWAELCQVPHAVAVNNCTAGLHLALLALGVGPGDDVLVADYTFPATGHSVLFCGARPVFVDVRPDSGTIDPTLLEAALTPQTRGIVAVDTLGQAADYEALETFAGAHDLFLVEDAACSTGATYQQRPTGVFGDIACFSLHARKGITAGEGGMVTTSSQELADRVRKLSCFGMQSAFERQQQQDSLPIPIFDELGYNYKLSDILAAVALVQIDRLPDLLERRRQSAKAYTAALVDLPGVTPPRQLDDREHTWQSYAVRIEAPVDRDQVAVHLRDNGVQCNIGTYASHLQPVYGNVAACPESARIFGEHLALPMHANLSSDDINRVVSVLADAVERHTQTH